MKWVDFERFAMFGTRLLALVAVWGSGAGAVLMFFLGLTRTYDAFLVGLRRHSIGLEALPAAETMVIFVIEALDLFLIGIALLYFAFGVYALFVRTGIADAPSPLPRWLNVEHIGQLKQVIAEVIVVVLFVLFLRVALQSFHQDLSTLSVGAVAALMVLPLSILALSLALKFAELHPKGASHDQDRSNAD